jgi:hypothetical protein
MNDPLYNQFRESNWRRKLAPGEEAELRAWLAAHPEMESEWEVEAGLTEALGRLPDAAVPSNFTARVLSRVGDLEYEAAGSRLPESGWRWAWRVVVPKTVFATIVLGMGLFLYERQQAVRRVEFGRNLATVSGVMAVPDPELLKDFEAIRQLDQTPRPDEQLLVLLK